MTIEAILTDCNSIAEVDWEKGFYTARTWIERLYRDLTWEKELRQQLQNEHKEIRQIVDKSVIFDAGPIEPISKDIIEKAKKMLE
jgi:hypothetical protein